MRNVVAGLFVSLDGVVEAPERWSFDHFDDDMVVDLRQQLATQDAVLLGRVTYQEWAAYWPAATDEPFASFINGAPKYVVSTTLRDVVWGERENISLLDGDWVNHIARLKQQPGKSIGTGGSPTLVRALLEHNLLDELRLAVYPVLAGQGERLFRDSNQVRRLRLVDARTTRTGVVLLSYRAAA